MSNDKKLIERGAQSVAGNLLLRNKIVGLYNNGDFSITEDGLSELEVVDVEAKPVKPAAPPKAPKAPSKKAAVDEALPAHSDELDADTSLDDLLGE